MMTITAFLTDDHRHADKLFAAVAQHAARRDWHACEQQLVAFRGAFESHLKIEEQVLFPAFEQASGFTAGPTAIMRREHEQMLEKLDAVGAAIVARDAERFHAFAEPFSALMAAHSAKEENVLYPLCDQTLDGLSGEKLQEMMRQP